MKKSFLDTLVNKTVEEAKKIVEGEGLKCLVVAVGNAISMELKPKTVILWEKTGEDKKTLVVSKANAGDMTELTTD